ncbi:DNA-binding NtrC family response regulator [Natronocella acetinitrilica]|uniref:DNA-binding NtrC family response regulator n=1 Tax=Natronocella acetinitrilica TaxID=414046 RepID=A0AAE3KHU2_9GAMM|nr:DNA-binding NtrC family response regulator [Natronocella acetinitrilica]
MKLCLLEDDAIMGESLRDRFEMEGYGVDWFRRAGDAERALAAGGYQVFISDIRLPDETGDNLFRRLQRALGTSLPPVIFITGYGSIETAVTLLKAGAADYVVKPFDLDELVRKVRELAQPDDRDPAALADDSPRLGVAPAMRRVEAQLRRLAVAGASVLIVGESGVGKEYAARYFHEHGAGAARPFVAVNCGALTESLLEAELFGHERGAFTGAQRMKRGVFEQAAGGTLFLDEIGDMPLPMQVRLLRAIQERQITRVGGETPIDISLTLVSATHRDLRALVAAGEFREDLYYRVNTVQVRLPPLRERPEDILWFARRFLDELAAGSPPRGLSRKAEQALLRQPWPGNLRELRHCLERAILLADVEILDAGDLFDAEVVETGEAISEGLSDYLQHCERDHIRRALARHAGRITSTAESLGISRKNLWEKMRKLGISADGSSG